jgi:phage baseplate assembly protein W
VDAVPAHLLPDRIEGEAVSEAGVLFGRGIAFPPRVGPDGRVAWSEGEANIRDAIRVILLTDRNERLRLPDFGAGLGRFLFEPNTVATRRALEERIVRALAAWEPRLAVESVEVEPDPDDAEAAIATIEYKLVATQVRERTTLTVALAG